MTPRRFGAFLCSWGCLAVAGEFGGREARAHQAEAVRLTLEDAVAEALTNNPAYRRAENSLRLNAVETRSIWMNQLLPQARLSLLNTNFSGNLQRIATDNFGDPIARPDAQWSYFSGTSQSLSLSWQTQGPSAFQSRESQRYTNRSRELGLWRADRELRVNVERFYLEALEQTAVVAAEEALVEARIFDLEVVEELYALALRSRVEVRQAALAVAQQRATLRRASGAYDQALLELTSYIGVDGSSEVTLADEPPLAFDPSGLDEEALVARALEESPSMRESGLAMDQAGLGLAQSRNRWWPSLNLSANVYRRSQGVEGSSLFDFSYDEDLDYSFYVGISFPLLNNFFGDQAGEERAKVDLANQIEAERETRLAAEQTTRSSLLALANQWETLLLEEETLAIAEEALELAREEYRLGSRSYSELRSSIESEADARRNVIAARFAFHESLLALEEAVGGSVRPTTAAGG